MAKQGPPLRAGTWTAVLDQEPVTGGDEANINQRIAEIESRAWSAGFTCDIGSVSYTGGKIVILYRLENDPSFRPPM